jgi:hypothetical protein
MAANAVSSSTLGALGRPSHLGMLERNICYSTWLHTILYILSTINNAVLDVESLFIERGRGRVLFTVHDFETGLVARSVGQSRHQAAAR